MAGIDPGVSNVTAGRVPDGGRSAGGHAQADGHAAHPDAAQ
jgi:hypothetical protein